MDVSNKCVQISNVNFMEITFAQRLLGLSFSLGQTPRSLIRIHPLDRLLSLFSSLSFSFSVSPSVRIQYSINHGAFISPLSCVYAFVSCVLIFSCFFFALAWHSHSLGESCRFAWCHFHFNIFFVRFFFLLCFLSLILRSFAVSSSDFRLIVCLCICILCTHLALVSIFHFICQPF